MKALFPTDYNVSYATTYRIASFILAIPIVVINTFLLILIWRMKLVITTISYQVITLLALSDLLNGIVIIAACIIEFTINTKAVIELDWFCQYLGTTALGLICFSAFLVALLAVERYLLVCKSRMANSKIVWTIIITMIITYAVPLIVVGVKNDLGPDPVYGYCLPVGGYWAKYMSFLLITSFFIPIIVVVVCYVAISRRCFMILPKLDSNPIQLRNAKLKVATKSVAFILLYSLCYLPKFISSIWLRTKYVYSYPRILDVIGPLAVVFTHLLNPLLILIIHSQFRREARFLLFPRRLNRISTDSGLRFIV